MPGFLLYSVVAGLSLESKSFLYVRISVFNSELKKIKKTTKRLSLQNKTKHVSTEISLSSSVKYKAMEAEFIISRK